MKKRMVFPTKIWIEVLDCLRWIVGVALTIMLLFAWVLRDGLGPDSRSSTGCTAVVKMFSFLGGWVFVLALLFVALSVVICRLYRRKGDANGAVDAMATTTLARGVVQTLELLLLLGLIGVAVLAGVWKKQRYSAESIEHVNYMDAVLEQVIPSLSFAPPATFGDAVEYFDKCVFNCLCPKGHDDKGRIRIIANIDEELMKKPMHQMRATDIKTRDALRLVCEDNGCGWDVNPSARTITIYEIQGCVLPVKRTVEPFVR